MVLVNGEEVLVDMFGVGTDGRGLAMSSDNKLIFIDGVGEDDERVLVEITSVRQESYLTRKLEKVKAPAKEVSGEDYVENPYDYGDDDEDDKEDDDDDEEEDEKEG